MPVMRFSLKESTLQMVGGIALAVATSYFFWFIDEQNIGMFAKAGIGNSIIMGVAAGLSVWAVFRFPLVRGALVAIEKIRTSVTGETLIFEVASLGLVAITIGPIIVGFMTAGQFYLSVGLPKLINTLPLISVTSTNSAIASVYASVFVALLSNAVEVYSQER